jgi:hypothetical protein
MSPLEGKISLIDKREKETLGALRRFDTAILKIKMEKIVDLPPLILLVHHILPIALTSL